MNMRKIFLLRLSLLSFNAFAQGASNMTAREKCEVIADYMPHTYQRYIDGFPKEGEYNFIDQATEGDSHSRAVMREVVDIVYDMPKYSNPDKVDLLKIGMRQKIREKCLNEFLDSK